MACKQETTVAKVDGFPNETPEKASEDKLAEHVGHVVRTWALVKKDLVGNGVIFYARLVCNVNLLLASQSLSRVCLDAVIYLHIPLRQLKISLSRILARRFEPIECR